MTKRQEEIIEKSIELIAEKGIQGLTIKILAKKINVTEPAIYRHFENKTEILLTMLNNLDEKTNLLYEKINERKTSPLKKLEQSLLVYFNAFADHPYWASVVFSDEIFKNEKILSDKIGEMLKAREEQFVKLISKAQRENLLRKDVNKKHIAVMLIGSLRLMVKRWELQKFSFDLKKEGKKLAVSLIKVIAN